MFDRYRKLWTKRYDLCSLPVCEWHEAVYYWCPSQNEINIDLLIQAYGVTNFKIFQVNVHATYFSIVVLFFLLNVLLGLSQWTTLLTANHSSCVYVQKYFVKCFKNLYTVLFKINRKKTTLPPTNQVAPPSVFKTSLHRAGYGFPLRSNIYIERCTVFACVSFWYHFHIDTAKTNMNCQTDLQKNDWTISWLPSFWHHEIVSGWLCPLLASTKKPVLVLVEGLVGGPQLKRFV